MTVARKGGEASRPAKQKSGRLALEGAVTIYNAMARKAALFKALDAASDLEINLAGVDEMDTAGVQLLVLLKREAGRAGKTVRLVDHSTATLEVLERYSLTSYFGDPVVLVSDPK